MDAVGFFLAQHTNESFSDRVFGGLTDAQMRRRPAKGLNSLVWLLWHMARVEDVAVNLVVTDGRQVLDDDWIVRLNVPWRHIGTGMTEAEVGELSERTDVAAVREYRSAVRGRTRDVVRALRPEAWDEIVGFADTSRAAAAGAFRDHRGWVTGVGYPGWQGHSRATRLAGSAIGHNAIHVGEAVTIRGLAGWDLGV